MIGSRRRLGECFFRWSSVHACSLSETNDSFTTIVSKKNGLKRPHLKAIHETSSEYEFSRKQSFFLQLVARARETNGPFQTDN